MEERPKFTIGIPVSGNQENLTRAVRSISDQTYPDFEVLFVNDRASQKNVELMQGLSNCFSRIRMINNKQAEGISNSRNALIDNAKGEYILFVGPNDTIEPELLSTLREYTYDDVDIIKYQMTGNPEEFSYPATSRPITGEEAIIAFSRNSKKKYAVANTMCYRRRFLKWCGFEFPYDRKMYEDVAALPMAIASAKQFVVTDYEGYHYNRERKSKSKSVVKQIEELREKQIALQSAYTYSTLKISELRYISSMTKKAFFEDMERRRTESEREFRETKSSLIKGKNIEER